MEETFSLTWEDAGTVVQNEEVVCIEETEIIPGQTEEFQEDQEIEIDQQVQGEVEIESGGIMYLTDDNILVMQDPNVVVDNNFPQHLMDCQVTEEVIAEQWVDNCQEEIIVGSEEAIGISGEQTEDVEIPLPTDQDEYTAARPYPCDFCSRRFRKKANLMNHMVAHQTDKPHGCNLCGVRYIRKCDLMNHLKIHAYIPDADAYNDDEDNLDDSDGDMRKNRKMFNTTKRRKRQKIKEEFDSFEGDEMESVVASSSNNYYTSEDMMEVKDIEYVESGEMRYPITDHRKPFVCQHCGVGFAREKALASHSRVHGGDSPFECQKCNEMFWDAASMREHWRTKHGGLENLEDDDEDEDYSEDDHKYGTFYCTTCGLSFHRQDNLKRHQRIHTKDEMMEPELGHICNVCGESFPEALDLLAHAEVHARTTIEHRCMICGEDFEDEQGCAVHVQEKHGKDLPPNTCMLCGRQCKDRRTLLKHSWEHSKEKVFTCTKCSKVFLNKARLKRHMLSHRNKVVNCDVCGMEFPDGRSLMNHRHSHSSVSGRQFPCRECGKTFGSRSSQQIHIRIHTGERPYGCRFCWKAFADGGTLRKHERIHTGEKPYACAVCPRAFNQRVVLREHIRSHHSGPDPKYAHSMTPYCCAVCSDMFATSQDLILHLIHHCDLNTAMNRQPQVGPRKYKRRRKLKPHELGLLQQKLEEEQQQNPNIALASVSEVVFTESDVEKQKKPKVTRRRQVKPTAAQLEEFIEQQQYSEQQIEDYNDVPPVQSEVTIPPSAVKIGGNIVVRKKLRSTEGGGGNAVIIGGPLSRPKMIHTQKTRLPLEPGEDGRGRHKTRTTIITRTQSTELKSVTGDRIRPRTKNVSYHVFNSEKIPLATFPEDVTAVNNLLKEENQPQPVENNSNGLVYLHQVDTPEVAVEQTVESEAPVPAPAPASPPAKVVRAQRKQPPRKATSLKPGRHIIGPGSKVRMIKSGMIVKKKTKAVKQEVVVKTEQDEIEPAIHEEFDVPEVKSEIVEENEYGDDNGNQEDPSPLHELAEISMQHAQNSFRCEMCSAVFADRAQLLLHVPIHI